MKPRLTEVATGEIRTLCHGCGRIIEARHLYCEKCKPTKGRFCASCGKPSIISLCHECKACPPQILSESSREVVEKMWAEKATAKQIADHLGVRTRHPGVLISKARRRGWDLPYRRPDLIKLGRKNAKKYLSKGGAETRMRRLPGIAEILAQDPHSDAARAAVERMWAERFTAREISENMGWSLRNTGANITKARNRGWNLPYRNPGVVEDSREKMRAVNA